jgi:hypothetical protein
MNYRIIAVRTYIDYAEPEDSDDGVTYPLGFADSLDDAKKLVRDDMGEVIQEEIDSWGYGEGDEETIQELRDSYTDDLDSVTRLMDFHPIGTLTKEDDESRLIVKYLAVACEPIRERE